MIKTKILLSGLACIGLLAACGAAEESSTTPGEGEQLPAIAEPQAAQAPAQGCYSFPSFINVPAGQWGELTSPSDIGPPYNPQGYYRFVGSAAAGDNWSVDLGGTVRASDAQPYGNLFMLDHMQIVKLRIRAPNNARPGTNHAVNLQFYNSGSSLVCSQIVTLRVPMACNSPIAWWNGTQIQPGYDSMNCYVAPAPAGSTPFTYGNAFYIGSDYGTNCAQGSYDSANRLCYLQAAPPRHFIQDNRFYYMERYSGGGPTCPNGGSYDGVGCYIRSAPAGTEARDVNGNWYITPNKACPIAGNFDGANCWLGYAPAGTIPFVYDRNFYYAEQ